jgi:hypothetical protein
MTPFTSLFCFDDKRSDRNDTAATVQLGTIRQCSGRCILLAGRANGDTGMTAGAGGDSSPALAVAKPARDIGT